MSETVESDWETVDDEKRQQAFWNALVLERKNSEFKNNHFLNVANDMKQILESDHIDTVRRDVLEITQDEMKRRVLLLSAREFYEKWEERQNDGSPITKCVWAIFRGYIGTLKQMRQDNSERVKENKNKSLAEARKEASRKRAMKEREEMLRLGKGDLNLGAKLFSERMRKEQAISREKDSCNVSLVLQKKFEKWWNSPLSIKYRSTKTDLSVVSFGSVSHSPSRRMTIYRKCNETMLGTLFYFVSHSKAGSLSVKLTQSWDATTNPYSVPMPVIYWGGEGMSPLKGQERLMSPQSFVVRGLHQIHGKYFIVSDKYAEAYSLFPEDEGFHKFEHLNPKVTSRANVLYAVQGNVDYISITSEHGELVIQKRERGDGYYNQRVHLSLPLPEELSHLFPTNGGESPVTRYVGNNIARLEAERAQRAFEAKQ